MIRLFVPSAAVGAGRVQIAGDELRHVRTLRLKPGSELVVFDDTGTEHTIVLETIDRRAARGRVLRSVPVSRESPLDLILAPALLKGPRMDVLVEKATELGVRALAPVVTRHCVASGAHLERWRRIALAAAKQCGRTSIPRIDEPAPIAARLGAPWPGLRLLAWEDATASGWHDLPARAESVVVLLGPEGGFAADEAAAARAAGFHAVSLGRRVLRAETAAIVAAAVCQHRWGDG
jgi:16S rRNA (uracil1498-N3)-methyltransferase